MMDLARGVGVYTAEVDNGPDLWAILLALAALFSGVGMAFAVAELPPLLSWVASAAAIVLGIGGIAGKPQE